MTDREVKSIRVVLAFLTILICTDFVSAQTNTEPIRGIPIRSKADNEPISKISLTVGYGFPNVDQSYLPQYYGYNKSGVTQAGPMTFSFNYHFNKQYSAGLLLTYGNTAASYFATSDTLPINMFKAKLSSKTVFANFIRYYPGRSKFTPYSKIAIGINFWKQEYTTSTEGETASIYTKLPAMAYQGAIGANYPVYKSITGFAELGYGKCIVSAGLSVRL